MAVSRPVLPLVAALFASTVGAAADRTLYLPGAAETPGAAGARFSTTLSISNTGNVSAEAVLGLIPSPGRPTPPPVRRVLLPQASLTVPSALAGLFGPAYDAGTITVTGTQDLVASLITANVADPSGSYGIGVSGIPSERLLARGDVAHALWVSDSGDPSTGFRTNVAVTFVDDGSEVEIRVIDGEGTVRETRTVSAPRPVAWQTTMASLVTGALDLSRVEFRVRSGRAVANVVVNDNLTSDALVVLAQRALDATDDMVLTGAARGLGEGGLDWGTDVRVFNPGESAATVTLSAIVAGAPGQPLTLTVPAGRVGEVLDVLAALGLPPGAAATVRIESSIPVLALGRTARADRTGAVPGSYAAQLAAVSYPDGLLAQGGRGYLTGLSHVAAGPGTRTSLSLFAGPTGAEGTLALRDESGALTAQTAFTLAPAESRRGSLDDWFLGGVTPPHLREGSSPGSVAPGSRVDVLVGSGAVDALAVQVDSGSGDPFAQRPIPGCETLPVAIEDFRISPAEPKAGEPATLAWVVPSNIDSQTLVETQIGNVPLSRTQRDVTLTFGAPGEHSATLAVFRGCQRDARTITFRVVCATTPLVETSALPPGYPGVPYGPVTLAQSGGDAPVSWTATGLPPGLVLSPDGVLSGTPSAAGTFQPAFTVTDANGCTGSRTLSLAIGCPNITVGPGSLPTGYPGDPYGPVTLTQSGGALPVTWTYVGTLPAGITFTPDGVLSGIPTEVGTFPVTFRVTDGNGCEGSVALSIRILCPPMSIQPTQLPTANPGVPYGPIGFTLVGGRPPVTWSASGLPAGLQLSPSGVLSGTTTASGVYTVTVQARDARGCTEQAVYQLSTEGAPTVVATVPADGATAQPTNVNLTVTFSEPVTLTGSWFLVSCATGSTPYVINPSTAVVTGGPTTWTIDPMTDIPPGATPCTVTIFAASVTDEDTFDPPDQMAADYVFTFSLDPGPYVVSTIPAAGSTAAASTNVTVTFNEPVGVSGSWLSVACSMSGTFDPSNSVVTGGPTVFVLDPPVDLSAGDVCFATVFAPLVTDLDPADPPDQMAANYSFDFSVDSAPAVVATVPSNGASSQPSNVSATVTFSEPVTLTGDWFVWTCGSGPPLYTISAATSVVTGGPTTFTIDPVADIPPLSSPCTVTVFASQVTDADGFDPPDQMAADHVFAFTLDAPPVVVATLPAAGATGVPGTTNVTVTFSEPVAVSGDWLVVTCSTSGTFSPSNSVVTGGPTTFVLDPPTDIAGGDSCVATVVGALVTDLDAADPPDQMPGNQPFAFTTDAAPAVASTLPADGATSQPANVSLTVTFDEPVALNGSWFLVSCATGSTPYVISPATAVVTGGPTTWTIDPMFDIPAGATPCTVTIYAAGVTDVDTFDPPDQMAADHVFTFSLDPGPYVVSTVPATGTIAPASTTVTVTFNEPVALGPTWLQVSCLESGLFDPSNSVVTGGPTTWVLDPPGDLLQGDVCSAVVTAAQVTDLDTADPPDQMAADTLFDFSVDGAPFVVGTVPPSGATQVPANVSLTVDFDEPVSLTGDWFLWSCGSGPTLHTITPATAVVTGGPASYTIDPLADIPPLSTPCTVTFFAAQVADVDTVDPPDQMNGDTTVFFDLDAPPLVVSTLPADGAVNVLANATVTVDFSEPVSPTGNWIRVVCSTSGTHDTTNGVVIGSVTTFTLDPSVDFAGGEVCQATVVAALVTDLDAADPPDTMPADHVFTFSVDAAPAVVSTVPANGAANQAASVSLTVTFDEPVALNGTWFDASCDTGSTPYVFGPATSVVTGGPTTFTIDPVSDIPPGVTACTVTIFAAGVTDLDTFDPPDQMAADHVFTFALDAPPAVVATDPPNGASAVATTANVTVTFSEPVAVVGNWLQVFCSMSGTFDPSNSVVTGGPTTFVLDPPVDLTPGDVCFATVLNTAVTDLDTGDPPDQMAAAYTFNFDVDTAPFVQSTVPADGATGVPADTTITVTFSEGVAATPSTFAVECPTGTPQPYALSASPSSTFVLTPSALLPVGTVCTVTVFAAQVADVDTGDPPDGLTADFVFSFQLPPAAVNDGYPEPVIGNVGIDSVRIPWSVLDNDSAPPTVTISAWDAVSSAGGAVTMRTSATDTGTFWYQPPTGYTGPDSFTYTLSSPGGTSTATVSLSVTTPVWFVNAAGCAGPCDGRLSSPFPSVASFQAVNDGSPGHPAAGQAVFLHESAAPYTGPVQLLPLQILIGQDALLPLALILGLPVGASSDPLPVMNPGPPLTLIQSPTVGVQLALDNALRGFTIGDTGTADLVGNGFGTLQAAEVSLIGTGQALDLRNGILAAAFDTVAVSTSPANGVYLSGTTGNLTVASGSLTGSQAAAFQVAGGGPTVTFGASLNHVGLSVASPAVDVADTVGGAVTFTAPVFGDETSNGVRVTNAAGDVSFTTLGLGSGPGSSAMGTTAVAIDGLTGNVQLGDVTIYTSSAPGISVTISSGQVGSTGGVVTSEFSPSIEVVGPAGGTPLAMTLGTVDNYGATRGISLTNTTGAFTITGDGTTPGSGGLIASGQQYGVHLQNATGVSLAFLDVQDSATFPGSQCFPGGFVDCSASIGVFSSANVALNGLRISRSGQMGIFGLDVDGLTLTNSSIVDVGATFSLGSSVFLSEPAGVHLIQDTTIDQAWDYGIYLERTAGPTPITIRRSTFSGIGRPEVGPAAVGVLADLSGVVTMLVDDSDFLNVEGGGIDVVAGFSGPPPAAAPARLGTRARSSRSAAPRRPYARPAGLEAAAPLAPPEVNLTVQASRFHDFYGAAIFAGAAGAGSLRTTVTGNQFTNLYDTALAVYQNGLGPIDAIVTANTVDNTAAAFTYGYGFDVAQWANGVIRARVDGNTILGTSYDGISVSGFDYPSDGLNDGMHVTVTNNSATGVLNANGFVASTDEVDNLICLDATANTFSTTSPSNTGMLVQQGFQGLTGTFQVAGMTVGPVTAVDVMTFLDGANTLVAPPTYANGISFTGVAPGTCSLPLPTPLP